jgi:elongation factor 2
MNTLIRRSLGNEDGIGPDGTSWIVSFTEGTVLLGSPFFAWLASLDELIDRFTAETGAARDEVVGKITRALETYRWLRAAMTSRVVLPLRRLHQSIEKQNHDVMRRFLGMLQVSLSPQELQMTWKQQLTHILKTILPATRSLLKVIVTHLPEPKAAQRYRIPKLIGWMNRNEQNEQVHEHVDASATVALNLANALSQCDPTSPVMMFIVKMIPLPSQPKQLVAIGRVFSGTVSDGQTMTTMAQSKFVYTVWSYSVYRLKRPQCIRVQLGTSAVLMAWMVKSQSRVRSHQ